MPDMASGLRRLVTSATRVGAQVTRERLRPGPAPTDLSDVPASADRLTPAWLTAALCGGRPGVAVAAIELGDAHSGTSARRHVRVTYTDPSAAADLPTALFTKSTPTFATRLLLGIAGMAQAEATFYNLVRPRLEVNAPLGYHASVDPRSLRSMIILEDVAHTRKASFGNALQALSRSEAEDVVTQLAAVHGAFWDSPAFGRDLAGLRTAHAVQLELNDVVGFPRRTAKGLQRCEDVVSPAVLSKRKQIWPMFMKSLALHADKSQALLHQDVHPGNWYRDEAGGMGLYDWQGLARGLWALDYAYALGSALTVDDRRAWESDLMELYLDRLYEAGGPQPSFARAWNDYAEQPLHGLVFWLFTIGRSRLEPELQPDGYSREIVHRLTALVDDHDTLARLARH